MIAGILAAAFWFAVATLLYTFFVYRYWIALLARSQGRPIIEQRGGTTRRVDVILVVHNEAARIRARIQNLLDSNYPAELLRVFVAADGCSDETVILARAFPS